MAIPKLTAEQRMEMVMRGLSPLNPTEVNAYLKGYGLSAKDKQEKLKLLLGEATNLGGAHEKEMIVEDGADPEQYIRQQPQGPSVESLRRQLDEDLSDYVSAPIQPRRQPQRQAVGGSFDTDGLMGFDKPSKPQVSHEDIMQEGFNLAKNYLNAFVTNLQESASDTTYVNRVALFKHLKASLEAEAKYKNNPQALKSYRAGVLKVEKAMLQKLQGGK
jgi:hypothetical protein